MSARLKDLSQLMYAGLCVAFWYWALRPHAIPHGSWADTEFILFLAGGVGFGMGGMYLMWRHRADIEQPVMLMNGLIALAVTSLLYMDFRGMPGTFSQWFLFVIVFFSFLSALYCFCSAVAPKLFSRL